jgi:ParB family transcriptional regulator, chromosome partitioning protein
VLEPILVRPVPVGKDGTRFEIVAGERRFRAATEASLGTVPVIVRELSDAKALELAVIENLLRQDLNPIE